jgi:tight adherence protein C
MFTILFACVFAYLAVFLLAYNLYSTREEALQSISLPKEILGIEMIEQHRKARPWARLVAPIARSVEKIAFFQRYKHKLVVAGSPMQLGEFAVFKIFWVVVCFVVGVLFRLNFGFLMLAVVIGYLFSDFWLKRKIAARHKQISKDLPVVIDLLKLCVGAGMDFMLAVQRVIKDFRPSPLVDELKMVWQEIQMGKARRDALRDLAVRASMPEISSFVRTLIQAGRMGSPIGDALKIHAEEVRMMRFARGEEAALKAPIKLLLPLIGFIMPVVLIIVAGPIYLQFMKGGMPGM